MFSEVKVGSAEPSFSCHLILPVFQSSELDTISISPSPSISAAKTDSEPTTVLSITIGLNTVCPIIREEKEIKKPKTSNKEKELKGLTEHCPIIGDINGPRLTRNQRAEKTRETSEKSGADENKTSERSGAEKKANGESPEMEGSTETEKKERQS